MRKLRYINSLGVELTLTNSAPFLLQNFDESESVNIITIKGAVQDGSTYLDNTLDIKDISIEFGIIANSESELIQYRDSVRKILNPKLGEGYLVYEDDEKERTIKCILNALPTFKTMPGYHGQNGKMGSCLISLTAHNPYWFDDENSEEVTSWIGGCKFKFKLPFKLKTRGDKTKNIYNDGDVETPLEIIFKGPAVNPSIINLTTNEFIKVNRTLGSDDTLYITTDFNNKKVEIESNGVRTNAFNYIDLDSTFFSLDIGDNMLEYTNDNVLDSNRVIIKYKIRHLGV